MRCSIVLPYYNAANHLHACLQSIARQSLTDFEVLAVNDGSSDGGEKIVHAFAAIDPRCIPLDIKHSGIVSALNTGIAAARSELIVRMDADDIMAPERLWKLWQASQSLPADFILASRADWIEKSPEHGAAQKQEASAELLDGRLRRYIEWSNAFIDSKSCRDNIFIDAVLIHPTLCFPRKLILKLGLYRDIGWPEDYDLLMRAVQSGVSLYKLDEVLLHKRDHGRSLSRLDARYARSAMIRAKAHFLLKHSSALQRDLVIVGSGAVGRELAAELAALGRRPKMFVDAKSAGQSREIQGIIAVGIDKSAPKQTFAALASQQNFFLLCIGDPAARNMIQAILESLGVVIWEDYLSIV